MTMNVAEYGSQRWEKPLKVNFETIIRGLKNNIFDWDQVWNPFHIHICKNHLQRKNGEQKLMEKMLFDICALPIIEPNDYFVPLHW